MNDKLQKLRLRTTYNIRKILVETGFEDLSKSTISIEPIDIQPYKIYKIVVKFPNRINIEIAEKEVLKALAELDREVLIDKIRRIKNNT